jgi:hypothetical protein
MAKHIVFRTQLQNVIRNDRMATGKTEVLEITQEFVEDNEGVQ